MRRPFRRQGGQSPKETRNANGPTQTLFFFLAPRTDTAHAWRPSLANESVSCVRNWPGEGGYFKVIELPRARAYFSTAHAEWCQHLSQTTLRRNDSLVDKNDMPIPRGSKGQRDTAATRRRTNSLFSFITPRACIYSFRGCRKCVKVAIHYLSSLCNMAKILTVWV